MDQKKIQKKISVKVIITTTVGPEPVFLVRVTEHLVVEPVVCGGVQTDRVVDTGAMIIVIISQHLKKAPSGMQDWNGPKVIMANGSPRR